MCGINGIFSIGAAAPAIDREELLRTREAMTSRGPDDAGAWVSADGRVGLASRRLAILDLSPGG
ncbi:MAG TPA: asparagine synthetase B, partial [Thermoanaerobaculia bacterium]|nr:asparagine synthetase B [Thermoanaerobaculia bacterium]